MRLLRYVTMSTATARSLSALSICGVGVGRYLRCMKPCGCVRVAHQWNLFQGRAPMRSCGPILHWPLHTRLRSWKPKRYRPPTRLRSCGGCEWCVTRGFLLSAYVEYTNQLYFQRITTLASLCPLHHCPFISISLSFSLSLSIYIYLTLSIPIPARAPDHPFRPSLFLCFSSHTTFERCLAWSATLRRGGG